MRSTPVPTAGRRAALDGAVDEGDEAGRSAVSPGIEGGAPQQEDVGTGGAHDDRLVDAVVRRTRVEEVDRVGARRVGRRLDAVAVGALLAVEREGVGGRDVGGLEGADGEVVLTVAAGDLEDGGAQKGLVCGCAVLTAVRAPSRPAASRRTRSGRRRDDRRSATPRCGPRCLRGRTARRGARRRSSSRRSRRPRSQARVGVGVRRRRAAERVGVGLGRGGGHRGQAVHVAVDEDRAAGDDVGGCRSREVVADPEPEMCTFAQMPVRDWRGVGVGGAGGGRARRVPG